MQDRVDTQGVWAVVEPWLFRACLTALFAALIAAAVFFGMRMQEQGKTAPTLGGQRAVVFDVVKLANAQRQIASTFIGRAATGDADPTILLEVQENTQRVVREVAGPGTIVLVKQAVVHTDLPDITSEVLKRLKLPVEVPTADTSRATLDYTPTILTLTPAPPAHKPADPSPSTDKALLP